MQQESCEYLKSMTYKSMVHDRPLHFVSVPVFIKVQFTELVLAAHAISVCPHWLEKRKLQPLKRLS
jgi:hypothetical protein